MDNIFSHAQPTPGEDPDSEGEVPPAIEAQVTVPTEAEQAYEGFTDYIHLWWPVKVFSAFGSGSHVGFESGTLIEESEGGRRQQWATVSRTQFPSTDHPGRGVNGILELEFSLGEELVPPSRVLVEFAEAGTGTTTVSLRHDGWAAGPTGREQYAKYSQWPEILGYYHRFMGGKA